MTLLQLKYIDTIARCGSFSKAAQSLYISQPAISKMVRSLEEELNISIFLRSSSGISLTMEGKELLQRSRHLLKEAEAIKTFFKEEILQNHKELRISSQHNCFIIDAFAAIQNELSGYSYLFQHLMEQTPEIIQHVRDGESNLGILFIGEHNRKILTHILEEQGLAFHPLFRNDPGVFLHASHPLAIKTEITLEDLAPYPCIFHKLNPDAPVILHEEYPLNDFTPSKVILVNDLMQSGEALISCHAYDIGAGIIAKSNRRIGIVKRPLAGLQLPVTIGYIARTNYVLSDLDQRFLEELARYDEETPGDSI